jgi:hypothetical protein
VFCIELDESKATRATELHGAPPISAPSQVQILSSWGRRSRPFHPLNTGTVAMCPVTETAQHAREALRCARYFHFRAKAWGRVGGAQMQCILSFARSETLSASYLMMSGEGSFWLLAFCSVLLRPAAV